MDGNSAKKAPVLDHLVDTANSPKTNPDNPAPQSNATAVKRMVVTAINGQQPASKPAPGQAPDPQDVPQNRRTDKSQFEIELTKTVNRILMKHFEHVSEEIVTQVLSEVRARLPGQRKA